MFTSSQNIKLGRYQITKLLSRNEFGITYEAIDTKLKRDVLLKEIAESLNKVTSSSQIDSSKAVFSEKVKIFEGIDHKSLIKVYSYFSEINFHYLVIEKIKGDSLDNIIKGQKNPLTLEKIREVADQLFNALNYLHTKKPPIIHADIKPQKIYIDTDGNVKLSIDHLAKFTDLQSQGESKEQNFDSETLAFSPLEKIWKLLDSASQKVIFNTINEKDAKTLEESNNVRSDIYELGATLYFLTTAHLPLDVLTRLFDIVEGKSDPLPTPFELNPKIPQELSNILMKALQIKQEDRFDSINVMQKALQDALPIQHKPKPKAAVATKSKDEDILEVPLPKPRILQNVQTTKKVDDKKTIELIKKQLQEAERKRLAAEKRAAEAERLLAEKRQNSVEKNIEPELKEKSTEPESKNKSIDKKPIELEPIEPKSVEIIDSDPDISTTEINETASEDIFSSYGSDNNNKSAKGKRSFVKVAAGAFVLLIICGVGWGVFNYTELFSSQTPQIISSENIVSPAPVAEVPPTTIPETVESSTENVDENSVDGDNLASNDETENLPDTEEIQEADRVSDNISTSQSTRKPVISKTFVKRNKPDTTTQTLPKVTKKAADQPKPAQVNKKKSVTLDDLLKDN